MNIKLLRRIQRQIKREPRQFVMYRYFATRASIPNCGTAACIAGWAITFTATKSGKPSDVPWCFRMKPYSEGMDALDLTSFQATNLFKEQYWPGKFQRGGPLWKRAIARIEHMIKTGK